MLPLRYARAWLVTGILVLGIGLYSALAPVPSGMTSINDKLLHVTGFTVLMLWFGGIFAPRSLRRVALALVAYGLIIELLQGLTRTRQAEALDLVADVAGILLGWLLSAAGLSRWCSTLESWLAPRNP